MYATSKLLPALTVLLLAGCAAPQRGPTPPMPAAPAAQQARAERYVVDASELRILVYRDGPLKQLGHNHVIVSRALSGFVEQRTPLANSSFELELPLDSLVVDEPALRAEEGVEFPGAIAEADREGTRRNMLSPALLDAAAHPVLRLTSAGVREAAGGWVAYTRVVIRGVERAVEVPATVRIDGDHLEVRGELVLTHGALGLTPFSVAMGALRVRDDITIRYWFSARRS